MRGGCFVDDEITTQAALEIARQGAAREFFFAHAHRAGNQCVIGANFRR
jgi:hypothetical protein